MEGEVNTPEDIEIEVPSERVIDLMVKDHDWLVNLHTIEERMLWQRFSLFLVMNSIIVTSSIFLLSSSEASIKDFRFPIVSAIAVFGLLLSIGWYAITMRGSFYTMYYMEKAKDIERKLTFKGKQILRAFNEDMKDNYQIQKFIPAKIQERRVDWIEQQKDRKSSIDKYLMFKESTTFRLRKWFRERKDRFDKSLALRRGLRIAKSVIFGWLLAYVALLGFAVIYWPK